MPRDHQHRNRRIAALDLLQDLEPVEPRTLQLDIEQHHRRAPLLDCFERLECCRPRCEPLAFILRHSADEVADVRSSSTTRTSSAIRHPHHCRCSRAAQRSPAASGKLLISKAIRTCVPPPGRSRKAISPVCFSTIFLTMAARGQCRAHAWSYRARSAARGPQASRRRCRGCRRSDGVFLVQAQLDAVASETVLAAFFLPSMASTPFFTTFVSACASCRRSHTMRNSPSGGSRTKRIPGCATSWRNSACRAIS